MPELPEVETIMRALAARLCGRRIDALEQRRPDLRFPLPERLAERLVGRHFRGSVGAPSTSWATWTTGTRSCCISACRAPAVRRSPPAGPHEHLTFHFDDASCLRYVDPRRFGMLDLAPTRTLGGTRGSPALASSRSIRASPDRRWPLRWPGGRARSSSP